MMALPFERRRSGQARFPIRVPALTEPIQRLGGSTRGEAEDLSSGGVLLRLEQDLVPGDPVRVTLCLTKQPPLTMAGTVAWAHPHPIFAGWALGVRFNEELPWEMVGDIADAEHPPWLTPRANIWPPRA